jgi:xanthine dehydrogenase YagS FAD-binding subunit
VNPSDTAPALIALDAQFVIKNGDAERVVPAEEFFIGPGIDITRLTMLRPGDLLTAIRIPATFAGKGHYFEKVRDRQVWDFALVNIAASMNVSGQTMNDVRMVVNGVAATPYRLHAVEAFLKGKPRDKATADRAADMAVEGAAPLRHNAYKVPLMKALVKRAIRGDAEWTS